MVPLLLHHLGTSTYGLYATLTSVVGYFGLLTFGSTLTVPRYVAEHAAHGDTDALGTFVSTYLAAHLAVAAVGFAAALALAPLLVRVLAVPAALHPLVAPAFRLVAAGWALGLTAGLWQSMLTGMGDVHLANLANSVRTVLNLSAAAAAVAAGGDLDVLLAALMVSSLLGAAGAWWVVRRRHPDIPIALRRARLGLLRATGPSASFYFLMQVAALVVMGTDNIVIGAFRGVGAVAPYAVAFQLWAMSLAVLWSGVDALMPFFTRWHARGELERLRDAYVRGTRAVVAGSALAALVLGGFGALLIRWWVGPSLAVEGRLLWVFAALCLTATPIHMAALLLAALGRHRPAALGGAAEAVLNLSLSLLLVRPLGVFGVALATLLSALVTNAWVATGAAARELDLGVWAYVRQTIVPALPPTLVAGLLMAATASVIRGSFPLTAGALVLVVGSFAGVFWWRLDEADRRVAWALVRRSPPGS